MVMLVPAVLPEAFSVDHQCHFSRHKEFVSRMEMMASNLSLMRVLAKQTNKQTNKQTLSRKAVFIELN